MFEQTFVVIPKRIWDLPDITLQFLKFYETIFQFWHRGKKCFLTNQSIKDRTGIKSTSTLIEAFSFFEQHNEMKRITNDSGKRLIIDPRHSIEFEEENEEKGYRSSDRGVSPERAGGIAPAIHNINNINKRNITSSNREREDIRQEGDTVEKKASLSLSDFKTPKAIEICTEKNLDFDKVLMRFMNHHDGKEISVGKFINWIENERPIKISPIITPFQSFEKQMKEREERKKGTHVPVPDYLKEKWNNIYKTCNSKVRQH